jgi:hypothetical protein
LSSRLLSGIPLLDNGIGLYRFRYKGSDRTAYVGVMAQEVQPIVPEAVSRGSDGYLRVNYERLGISFMTWKEWLVQQRAVIKWSCSCDEAVQSCCFYRAKAESW